MPYVRLNDVSFTFPVYGITNRSLKVTLMKQFAGGLISSTGRDVEINALRNLNFSLEPGDRLGLIGHNGSGKTTLLRLLAGLTKPSSGKIEIDGRVIPLIDKGLGIHQELTGAQNIELPMRLLGATNEEVRAAEVDIPEWTELGQFIDLPVRTYSEGMRARLLFAICTAIPCDILILDEWLGAGDMSFTARAEQRLMTFIEKTQILVLATHSIDLLRRFCNRLILLDKGQIIAMGDPEEVLDVYFATISQQHAAAE